MDVKVIELPVDPRTGPSLEVLRFILNAQKVKAYFSIPNFNNPTGYVMEDAVKEELVDIARKHDIILIEDDIYGDLNFNGRVSGPRRLRTSSKKYPR